MAAKPPQRRQIEQVVDAFGRPVWRTSFLAALQAMGLGELSMTDVAVIFLLAIDGEHSLGELAAKLERPMSTVSRVVDALVRAGYVKRSEAPHDRRARALRVADGGEKLIRRMEQARVGALTDVIQTTSPRMQWHIFEGFRALADAALARLERGADLSSTARQRRAS